VLALLVHGLLIVALAFSVNWRASEPTGITAELWAAVPQLAAPRAQEVEPQREVVKPTPPAPPPRAEPEPQRVPDAQIATEREKAKREELKRVQLVEKEEQERKKKELDKQKEKEKAALDKKEADARTAEAAIETEREKNIKRILGDASATGAAGATGAAAQTAGPSAGYAGRVRARVKPNIFFADAETVAGNPQAEVEVRCAPDGTIQSRRLVKSSGIKEWDDAVLRAIDKTEMLPRDVDGRVPSPIVIGWRPRD
jgi:colicin import membrane protein